MATWTGRRSIRPPLGNWQATSINVVATFRLQFSMSQARINNVSERSIIEFDTARLRLRQWCDSDREPFASLNSDPEVMEFFPSLLTRFDSDASIDLWQSQFA